MSRIQDLADQLAHCAANYDPDVDAVDGLRDLLFSASRALSRLEEDSVLPLTDDPRVPAGSVFSCDIVVTQYLKPDGDLAVRTWYSGGTSLSQALGLLRLAEHDLIRRSDR